MDRRHLIPTWLLWIAVMAALTVVMTQARSQFDQVHVVLMYLLVVLGGSATGGRALGVSLACAGFVLIDYFFQPPFGDISVGKSLDWLALIAFLATALVATQLLARAQAEADAARRRTEEVASLARLGSETLSAGRAEDALSRIAAMIKTTLGVDECAIVAWSPEQGFGSVATPSEISSAMDDDALLRDAVEQSRIMWVNAAGKMVLPASEPSEAPPAGDAICKLVLPLRVQGRVVGGLRIQGAAAFSFDEPQRRFLGAISYYAALAVDRVRLVKEAEHAEALREADRLKDIVLASVSHDLRTPLTTIKALAQSEAMQGNQAAAAIEEQADRLTRLVSDLLDLSRLKGGGFSVQPELNTAEDLLGAAVRQAQGLLDGRTLRTVVDLDSPALVGHFDFAQALRALGNLLENAIRYSPPGEPIELGATRDGDMLVFTVADRGPGVQREDVTRIFEPFYRSTNAPPDSGRAGLGLSIARTLTEMQGGRIDYQARPGGGSVFSLRLPATEVLEAALEQSA